MDIGNNGYGQRLTSVWYWVLQDDLTQDSKLITSLVFITRIKRAVIKLINFDKYGIRSLLAAKYKSCSHLRYSCICEPHMMMFCVFLRFISNVTEGLKIQQCILYQVRTRTVYILHVPHLHLPFYITDMTEYVRLHGFFFVDTNIDVCVVLIKKLVLSNSTRFVRLPK